MNLLTDPWIPVTHNGEFQHVRLMDVLCSDGDWRISLPRDDMEFAALQLAICLTQVILPPTDAKELREREKSPISESVYKKAIEPYTDWFVLDHPKHPFMQTRGVEGKTASPHKLFIGLPERTSGSQNAHSLFNDPNEIEHVCPSCAAIALFQQATNGVSLGSHFFIVGLKGMAPITTLLWDNNLRRQVWVNILSRDYMDNGCVFGSINDPTWMEAITGDKVYAHTIGLVRGLFWQPAKVELTLTANEYFECDFCGIAKTGSYCTGFVQEPHEYTKNGFWRHPHTPVVMKKGEIFHLKLDFGKPLWQQMMGFLWDIAAEEEGYGRANIVDNFSKVFHRDIHLSIGGYVSAKEKIIGRRHEVVSLPSNWEENMEGISKAIKYASLVVDELEKAISIFTGIARKKGLGKQLKKNIKKKGRQMFYSQSESDIHRVFHVSDWRAITKIRKELNSSLFRHARNVFSAITDPYIHLPEMLEAIAKGRNSLNISLQRYTEE